MSAGALVSEAERAVAGGDLKRAALLLEQAAADRPDDASLWMKAAALHRAAGSPDRALPVFVFESERAGSA